MGSKERQPGEPTATRLRDITSAWDEEIRRRVDAWEQGLLKEVPWEDVRAQARTQLEGK